MGILAHENLDSVLEAMKHAMRKKDASLLDEGAEVLEQHRRQVAEAYKHEEELEKLTKEYDELLKQIIPAVRSADMNKVEALVHEAKRKWKEIESETNKIRKRAREFA